MKQSRNSELEKQRILEAWKELQAAIKAVQVVELRKLITSEQELNLAKTSEGLTRAVTQLAILIREGDTSALQVLYAGCCKMNRAIDFAVVPARVGTAKYPGEELTLQAVRVDFDDAIDDLIDLVRLGEPGALQELLEHGASVAGLLSNWNNSTSDETGPLPSSARPTEVTNDPAQSDWRRRLDHAIEVLAKQPPGRLSEGLKKATARLPPSRFAIERLSTLLPDYDPEDPDIRVLYELCDQLVEKRLNPQPAFAAALLDFLDEARLAEFNPSPDPEEPEFNVPARQEGSPTMFAAQVCSGIRRMHKRRYPQGQLEDFRKERSTKAPGGILQELRAAKAASSERKWDGDWEKWLSVRSPSTICDQLVALLPPLSPDTVSTWTEAGVAFLFVWCDGEFEECTWPESVQKAVKSTGGTPSAIRKALKSGFEALARANPA